MPATPTRTLPASSKRRWRGGNSPPCCTASRAAWSWPSAGLKLGLYVSFSGVLTFKKSEALREVAAAVPLDRLLVETDAPYLAPDPFRGRKPNEPALVVHTAKALAAVKGVSFEALAAATTDNFYRLYSKVPRPETAA